VPRSNRRSCPQCRSYRIGLPSHDNLAHADQTECACLGVSTTYPLPSERGYQTAYTIDLSRAHRYQMETYQRRARERPAVFEQSPPSYDLSVRQSRLQPVPLFSSIRMKPTAGIRCLSTVITPSVHSAMPPSYAEIFLTPSPSLSSSSND
jgi:hypothetical protein